MKIQFKESWVIYLSMLRCVMFMNFSIQMHIYKCRQFLMDEIVCQIHDWWRAATWLCGCSAADAKECLWASTRPFKGTNSSMPAWIKTSHAFQSHYQRTGLQILSSCCRAKRVWCWKALHSTSSHRSKSQKKFCWFWSSTTSSVKCHQFPRPSKPPHHVLLDLISWRAPGSPVKGIR